MATVTALTAAQMKLLSDQNIIGGSVSDLGSLILTTRGGLQIDAGSVVIPGGAANQYFRGDKSWQVLDKNAVGLNNVDNVADLSKPVSNPQQTALNKLAKGLLYKQKIATSSGGITDAIVDNIPSFTFTGGRKYRIVWDSSYYQSVVTDLFYWSINMAPVGDTAALTTNLTPMDGRTRGITTAGTSVTNYMGPITAYFEPTVDTTTQLKFRIQRALGTGNTVAVSNGNETRNYLIYDDGAQF